MTWLRSCINCSNCKIPLEIINRILPGVCTEKLYCSSISSLKWFNNAPLVPGPLIILPKYTQPSLLTTIGHSYALENSFNMLFAAPPSAKLLAAASSSLSPPLSLHLSRWANKIQTATSHCTAISHIYVLSASQHELVASWLALLRITASVHPPVPCFANAFPPSADSP